MEFTERGDASEASSETLWENPRPRTGAEMGLGGETEALVGTGAV